MTHPLDDPARYQLDAADMFGHVERLGLELERAWFESANLCIPAGEFDRMVLVGMGGSAAAGDYLQGLAYRKSPFPVELARGYELAAHVDARSLVVFVSYSGETEETLACDAEAGRRGCLRMAITTGGELARRAANGGVTCHRIAYDSPPRAALAHTLGPLLRIADRAGAITLCDADLLAVTRAHTELTRSHIGRAIPAEANAAKQLAELLAEASPLLVFASEHLAAPARRAKNQFAENAKMLAVFEEIPEATHNAVVGLEGAGSGAAAIGFDAPAISAGNRRRLGLVSNLLEESGGAMAVLQARGTSRLADMLEATAWGDLLSCYLAVLRGIDPSPTQVLTRVRDAMAGRVEAPA